MSHFSFCPLVQKKCNTLKICYMFCFQVITLLWKISFLPWRPCPFFFLFFAFSSIKSDRAQTAIYTWKKERKITGANHAVPKKTDKEEGRDRKCFSGCKEKELSKVVPPGIHVLAAAVQIKWIPVISVSLQSHSVSSLFPCTKQQHNCDREVSHVPKIADK